MHKNWRIISKRIVVIVFVVFALSFAIFDFYNFSSISNKDFLYKGSSFGDSSNTRIFGNVYIPDSIIIKKLNKQEYHNDYNILLEDLKVITTSKDSKLILIEEKEPIFYDDKYIYLSSTKYLNESIDLNKKHDLILVKLMIDNKFKYTQAIQKVESMLKYFKNNHTQLYSNLDSIVYSQSQFLNLFISGCEIQLLKVHQDFFSDIELKEFERKIKNLDLFINNENKNMEDIKQIDLRWDNIGEREGMIVWKNN